MGNPWQLANKLYVNPNSNATQWCHQNPSDPRASAIQANIANVPTALWIGAGNVHDWIAGYMQAATSQQALPVLSLYAIQYTASPATYRAWIDQLTSAIGASPCAVVLETDAILQCVGASKTFQLTRFGLLQYAVNQFALHCPNTYVYLDGGDAYYNLPATLAPLLMQAGIVNAAGFSLNVANFNTTTTVTTFAASMNTELAKYGIPAKLWLGDVSRNGNGRPSQAYISAHPSDWMFNPPGMRLGQKPAMTGMVWVKCPGESDGLGGIVPNVSGGVFDPRLATALITGATSA